jgi:hypothetical protein
MHEIPIQDHRSVFFEDEFTPDEIETNITYWLEEPSIDSNACHEMLKSLIDVSIKRDAVDKSIYKFVQRVDVMFKVLAERIGIQDNYWLYHQRFPNIIKDNANKCYAQIYVLEQYDKYDIFTADRISTDHPLLKSDCLEGINGNIVHFHEYCAKIIYYRYKDRISLDYIIGKIKTVDKQMAIIFLSNLLQYTDVKQLMNGDRDYSSIKFDIKTSNAWIFHRYDENEREQQWFDLMMTFLNGIGIDMTDPYKIMQGILSRTDKTCTYKLLDMYMKTLPEEFQYDRDDLVYELLTTNKDIDIGRYIITLSENNLIDIDFALDLFHSGFISNVHLLYLIQKHPNLELDPYCIAIQLGEINSSYLKEILCKMLVQQKALITDDVLNSLPCSDSCDTIIKHIYFEGNDDSKYRKLCMSDAIRYTDDKQIIHKIYNSVDRRTQILLWNVRNRLGVGAFEYASYSFKTLLKLPQITYDYLVGFAKKGRLHNLAMIMQLTSKLDYVVDMFDKELVRKCCNNAQKNWVKNIEMTNIYRTRVFDIDFSKYPEYNVLNDFDAPLSINDNDNEVCIATAETTFDITLDENIIEKIKAKDVDFNVSDEQCYSRLADNANRFIYYLSSAQ